MCNTKLKRKEEEKSKSYKRVCNIYRYKRLAYRLSYQIDSIFSKPLLTKYTLEAVNNGRIPKKAIRNNTTTYDL